jgi:hypothetical protein
MDIDEEHAKFEYHQQMITHCVSSIITTTVQSPRRGDFIKMKNGYSQDDHAA